MPKYTGQVIMLAYFSDTFDSKFSRHATYADDAQKWVLSLCFMPMRAHVCAQHWQSTPEEGDQPRYHSRLQTHHICHVC